MCVCVCVCVCVLFNSVIDFTTVDFLAVYWECILIMAYYNQRGQSPRICVSTHILAMVNPDPFCISSWEHCTVFIHQYPVCPLISASIS